MQWLQPWSFLWAALLVPVIIFLYLLKRRYTDRTISSTLLWRRVMQQIEVTRPWQKLQRHLLLFLQLLAAVILIAALARPAVQTDGVTAEHTVLLLDTSASMLTREGDTDRLTLAKEEAVKLADSLQDEQTMTVVEVGAPPRVVVAETRDSGLLVQRLREIAPRYEPGDTAQSLSLARALASRHQHSEVILISDGSGWQLEANMAPDRFIAVGESKQNISIAQLSAVKKGESVEALARLENTGAGALSGTLSLYNGADQLLDTKAVKIEAGRSQVLTWDKLPPAPFYRAKLEIERDALALDNEYWAVPTATSSREALYAGESNAFLEKALRLNDRLDIVVAADGGKSELAEAGHYPLSVFNGIGSNLPETGNGLFFHPSDNFAGWNWGSEQKPKATIEQTNHPILQHVSLKDIYVAQARALETPPGWQAIVRSGDQPLILAGEENGERSVVFTFNLEQSDLPLRPEFPVLMHQIVDWLMPQEHVQLAAGKLGEATVIPVAAESDEVTVEAPSGETVTLEAEQFAAVYTPEEVGLYEVTADDGASDSQYFTVPFPEEETDIVPQPNLPTQQSADSDGKSAGGKTDGTAEIGRWFALAALLLLGVEWVVFTRGY